MQRHKQECLQLPLPKTMRRRRRGREVKDIKEEKTRQRVQTVWDACTEDRREQENKKIRWDVLEEYKWLTQKDRLKSANEENRRRKGEIERMVKEQWNQWCDKQHLTQSSSLHPVIQDSTAQHWGLLGGTFGHLSSHFSYFLTHLTDGCLLYSSLLISKQWACTGNNSCSIHLARIISAVGLSFVRYMKDITNQKKVQ